MKGTFVVVPGNFHHFARVGPKIEALIRQFFVELTRKPHKIIVSIIAITFLLFSAICLERLESNCILISGIDLLKVAMKLSAKIEFFL